MLDSISWGNPLQKHLPYIEKDNLTFLEKFYPQLIKYSFPKNTSKATREELNQLVDNIEVAKSNPEHLKRYTAYDNSLVKTFGDVLGIVPPHVFHDMGSGCKGFISQFNHSPDEQQRGFRIG